MFAVGYRSGSRLPRRIVILGPDDALAHRPSRIVVAGTSGSGKSTVGARIGPLLGIEHVDIDGLHHGPRWTPRASFEEDVDRFSTRPGWVTEWNYSAVRDRLADRADLLIWLDLPRRTVMRQVIVRTLRRRIRREVLWNGNVEPPLRYIFLERDYIVRWAWRTHPLTAQRVDALAHRSPDLPIVRLRSHAEVDRWLELLPSAKS